MFACFVFPPPRFPVDLVRSAGREWCVRNHAFFLERTARELLDAHSRSFPEYAGVLLDVEAATLPDGSYNYRRESLVLRTLLMSCDDELFGVPFAKDETVIVVDTDRLPDDRFTEGLSRVLGACPTGVPGSPGWDKSL